MTPKEWNPENRAPAEEPARSQWLWLAGYLFENWADERPDLWRSVEQGAWDILNKLTEAHTQELDDMGLEAKEERE